MCLNMILVCTTVVMCALLWLAAQDKKFKKEMDKLMESDEWKQGAGDALKFLTDPESMEALQKEVRYTPRQATWYSSSHLAFAVQWDNAKW